jgi:precorrin-6B methylase 2
MRASHTFASSPAAIALAALALCGPAPAQPPAKEYVPEVGQEGKDVVWVPSELTMVEKILDLAEVRPGDHVIDLGSGDGRTVIAAARRGAKALGIEYNPGLVELSKRNAVRAGVADRATFVEGDIFASDFSQATVLTLFLMPELNLQLLPTILKMKPGTRVVSNSFDMGSWLPDATAQATRDCKTYCEGLLWIVPAKVEGTWKLDGGAALELQQTYQMLSGTLRSGTVVTPVSGKLRGYQITFTAGETRYAGEVKGEVMEGSSEADAKKSPWRASRE